jgi:hypothetical protein
VTFLGGGGVIRRIVDENLLLLEDGTTLDLQDGSGGIFL